MSMTRLTLALAFALTFAAGAGIAADEHPRTFRAPLRGFKEVPAVSTPATGAVLLHVNDDETINWQVAYRGTIGAVGAVALHFAQEGANGGVVAVLCSNLDGAPAGVLPCPPAPATLSGVIAASDVVGGAAEQGIGAGELREVVRALLHGAIYVNVHTEVFPRGEIRGQFRPRQE
jgi:hypothetical protein